MGVVREVPICISLVQCTKCNVCTVHRQIMLVQGSVILCFPSKSVLEHFEDYSQDLFIEPQAFSFQSSNSLDLRPIYLGE